MGFARCGFRGEDKLRADGNADWSRVSRSSKMMRKSDMGNLGDMLDRSLNLQHAEAFHLEPGRTITSG
jgi:hypothetical protein